jgi:hypothetical protein
MCDSLELDIYLHCRDDGEPEWGELQSELLDSKPESGYEQWRTWQRAAMDGDRLLQRFWRFRRFRRLGRRFRIGLRGALELDGSVHGGHDCQFQRCQLHSQLLDSESESIN